MMIGGPLVSRCFLALSAWTETKNVWRPPCQEWPLYGGHSGHSSGHSRAIPGHSDPFLAILPVLASPKPRNSGHSASREFLIINLKRRRTSGGRVGSDNGLQALCTRAPPFLEFYQASAGQWRQGLFRGQHGPTLWPQSLEQPGIWTGISHLSETDRCENRSRSLQTVLRRAGRTE